MNASSIRIWQIYFQQAQQARLDADFLPLNNEGASAQTLEFDVFQRLWRSEVTSGLARWGALSWRFGEKTGLSGSDLLARIQELESVDVVYMNPFPKDEGLFESSWVQGEVSHPGLIALSEAIFASLGQSGFDVRCMQYSHQYSVCNYFIGTERFWSSYVPFVEEVLSRAELSLPPETWAKFCSSEADWRGVHHGASFIPFFVERLLPHFLSTSGRHLRAHQLQLPYREVRLSEELRELRELKDVAIRTASGRLLDRWRGMRRHYLVTHHRPEWCQRFLPVLDELNIDLALNG